MAGTPWWLAADPPDTPPLPWSGEVVPLDVPPIPVDVPIAGPPIEFIGHLEHAVWDDVWGFIKGASKISVETLINIDETIATHVVDAIENYVGNELKAFSGFINRAFDYTHLLTHSLASAILGTWDMAQTGLAYADAVIYGLLQTVEGIDNIVIPGLEAEIARVAIGAEIAIAGTAEAIKTWAIDNIYSPLLREVLGIDAQIRDDVFRLVGTVTGELQDQINAERLARIAAVAGIVAAIAGVTTWVDDCGQPMCDMIGPNTDLGKLLKGLKLAGELAALTAILNMNEAELVALIEKILAHLAAVVGDVEQFMGSGGETVAGLIAEATKDLI